VIDDAELRRIVLNHELDGDGWHQTAREGQLCQVDVLFKAD
jgi:hypothetical protein